MAAEEAMTAAEITRPATTGRRLKRVRPAPVQPDTRDGIQLQDAGSEQQPASSTAHLGKVAPTGNGARSLGGAARQPSKSTAVLKLLQRRRGATIAEIQEVTGWQAHSVRGFLSGSVRKRMGLDMKSETGADGTRRYMVAKA